MMLGEKLPQLNGVQFTSIAEAVETLSKLDMDDFVQRITLAQTTQAFELLHDLVLKEQFLTEYNSLEAYAGKLPSILERLEVSLLGNILSMLEARLLLKALFGNFRAVSHTKLIGILENIPSSKVSKLFGEMIFGIDLPKKAARVLSEMSPRKASPVVSLMSNQAVIRIFRETERAAMSKILERLDTERAFELCDRLLGNRNQVRISRVAGILSEMEKERSLALWIRFSPEDRLRLQNVKRIPNSMNAMSLKKAVIHISTMSPDEAAAILVKIEPEKQLEILKRMDSNLSSRVVALLAQQHPKTVAAILEEMAERILIPNGRCPEEMVYSDRAIVIRERMGVPSPALESTGLVRSNYPLRSGWGVKRSKTLGHGIRAIHIEESLKTESGTKKIVIDLLELDPANFKIKCCRSIEEKNLIPIEQIEDRLKDAGRDNPGRTEAAFKKLGLIRLTEMVKDSEAIAGINGGFYFDYGHYRDAHKVGHDLSQIPGLCYGDLVGWFVSDGVESSPPIVNRGSLVITKTGEIHIIKVFITGVVLPNGNTLTWDDVNTERKNGRTILFNSLYGLATEAVPHYIDLAVSRNRIYDIVEGGGVRIPISGFVLSLPTEKSDLLQSARVGDRVEIENNFPRELGEVDQAISCGPQLVRDGQPEIDFSFEDFGEKDSLVVPYSLTRAVDIFDAARSFVMLKDGKFFLSAVSGTLFGSGPPTISAGITFGELAQLAVDMGAQQALALDGGGSSSIAVRTTNGTKALNVPTGGSDVPQGAERFINTYLAVFPASHTVILT